jgi:hypothetical protein
MALVSNFAVTSTRALVLSSKPGTRQVNFTNNNVGSGSVYYGLVARGATSALTTGNGTLIPSQPNPYELILTPGFQASYASTLPPGSNDLSQGFDLYLISNTTAQISVQTVPI